MLAGEAPAYFGAFERCEFVGYEYPDSHSASRPDLKLICSTLTLYFENKLESPLSLRQMRRHAMLARRDAKIRLIFVSNIPHEQPVLKSLPGYIHPQGRDHFLWIDFLPVLANTHRKDSFAARVLADFDSALKAYGMVGRTLRGATGSLYTYNSSASHMALRQLRELLHDVGFKVPRKAERETTLRAYPTTDRVYPLLNPRFMSSATWLDEALDKDCLDMVVLSKGDGSCLDRHLATFRDSQDCAYVPTKFEHTNGYWYHGHFILPICFLGSRASHQLDLEALRKPLSRLLRFLRAGPS